MRLILPVGLIATTLAIAPVRFDREKVFRVKPQDEKQADIIKDLAKTNELDFWYPGATHHVAANMMVDFRVSEKESQAIQSALDQNKMHYEILIHDLQEEIEKQFDVKEDIPGRHSYAKYNNWEKIVAWTEKMMDKYPEMVSRIKIGSTVEDNPLYVLKIGEKNERRKAIFTDCGIHAREWVSPAFCQWFVYQATKTYGRNKIMTKLLDRMNFYILPVFNVDGYIWSWTKNRMWRKNRSKNQNSKCIGTDLNRNFNASWNSIPNTNDPCADNYRGSAPESEKETKAVTNFIRSHLNEIKVYITFHSYSQMLLFPYGYTSKLPPNHEDLAKVAKIGTDVLSTRYETRYIYGPIESTIYPISGSSLDWAYDLGIKHTFAFELRDKGKFGFLLPESRIKPTCRETMLAVKFIAKYILKHTS
ncbi:mast cell carboxypeptidase A preproprotein [Homo sapiens]|uniref:Mast cell carboxypeptidase A n=1 Tax=Homo sapiens TaxID=9606 RepID=CBPA3_HUMAN|nr:mast cell carboxypeptidase A preproprotein [Homo sapiens]P15088.2 RecName: Full=Mast cell carboxypeptidase A; Short=MC-CPA; AltName: Full=Carboxypeptidase A3; Flags: Precursor [Homo sapiens]|eukprot:NP_001861.2 mast cell carboxypeptidase A preproprotein [Homo sapiens]